MSFRGYYAILDVHSADLGDLGALGLRAERLLAARPCCLQVRGKGGRPAALAALARRLLPSCRGMGIPLVVNDRLDVALAVGADGVHLGQHDLPLEVARRLTAGRILIGISTHDPSQAEAAANGGADYIGFGPVFRTGSKATPDPIVGIESLRAVVSVVGVPVVAIGGIDASNVDLVAAAGASAAAAIAAVATAADPTDAGRALARAFA